MDVLFHYWLRTDPSYLRLISQSFTAGGEAYRVGRDEGEGAPVGARSRQCGRTLRRRFRVKRSVGRQFEHGKRARPDAESPVLSSAYVKPASLSSVQRFQPEPADEQATVAHSAQSAPKLVAAAVVGGEKRVAAAAGIRPERPPVQYQNDFLEQLAEKSTMTSARSPTESGKYTS